MLATKNPAGLGGASEGRSLGLLNGSEDTKSLNNPQDPRVLFVLGQLRIHSLRCKLVANEIDTIGVALKAGFISVECVLEWVADLEEPVPGLLRPREVAA